MDKPHGVEDLLDHLRTHLEPIEVFRRGRIVERLRLRLRVSGEEGTHPPPIPLLGLFMRTGEVGEGGWTTWRRAVEIGVGRGVEKVEAGMMEDWLWRVCGEGMEEAF